MMCNRRPRRRRRVTAQLLPVLAFATGVASPVVAADPVGAATTYCYGFEVTVVGTAAAETIDVTDGVTDDRDVIHGLGGDDVISGLGGDDVICGGDGRDWIFGGPGADQIAGNRDADVMAGGEGADRLEGFAGNDLVSGGAGSDYVDGGDGNNFDHDWGDDVLFGDSAADVVRGAAGDDRLEGGDGTSDNSNDGFDRLYSYGGDDVLRDIVGDVDELVGGDGDDHIDARDRLPEDWYDRVRGGNGTDTCLFDAWDLGVCEL